MEHPKKPSKRKLILFLYDKPFVYIPLIKWLQDQGNTLIVEEIFLYVTGFDYTAHPGGAHGKEPACQWRRLRGKQQNGKD